VQPAARPRRRRHLRHSPTVAIEQRTSRGGRKSTVATLTEIYHFFRLLLSEARHAVLPHLRRRDRAADAASIADHLLKQHKGAAILLLAPLVVARKGYYTELAKWANARGYKHLRVDGEMLTTYQWPRLNRFKEHTIELPVAQIHVQSDRRGLARAQRHQGAGPRQGPAARARLDAKKPKVQVFSIKRACPSCGTSFRGARSAPVLVQLQAWLVRGLLRHGLELEGFDEEQSGEEAAWNEWLEARRTPAKPAMASASIPLRCTCAFAI
jgi:excinuclease ABC subunit A